MIRLRFTADSSRSGDVEHVKNLKEARSEISCERPRFSPNKLHGYPKAWEVTCGDTVVADAMQLPPRAGEDYFPRYKLGKKRRKGARR